MNDSDGIHGSSEVYRSNVDIIYIRGWKQIRLWVEVVNM